MDLNKQFPHIPTNIEQLAEEAAEVIRIKSKCFRFGPEDFHKKNKLVNVKSLEQETGHFLAIVDILIQNGVFTREGLEAGKRDKLINMPEWYGRLAIFKDKNSQ